MFDSIGSSIFPLFLQYGQRHLSIQSDCPKDTSPGHSKFEEFGKVNTRGGNSKRHTRLGSGCHCHDEDLSNFSRRMGKIFKENETHSQMTEEKGTEVKKLNGNF